LWNHTLTVKLRVMACVDLHGRAWCRRPFRPYEGRTMNFHFEINALIALIAGILILIMPRLLNYVVALYLIIIGILGLVR
jgi:hypothetical protein